MRNPDIILGPVITEKSITGNQNGVYETDVLPIDLTNYVGSKVFQYCKKNDLIGIRGRLESKEGNLIKIVAEKVTFLSSNRGLLNQK